VGKISRPETEKLRARLRLFETKFPQSKFSVVLTRIANGAPISEYSFWLANRGNFTATDATGGDNFNLLLVIDVESAEAALVIGYGLEQYLSEKDLSDALERARSRWTKGDFSRGIRACVDHLMVRMRSVAWEIEKSTAPPASPIATEPAQSESEKSQ
jgi:uncharacterized membrane protein YgcG